jgi:SAM-dependent methyltransferase/uncharacterized protein YbaR (Trm112 family)
MRASLLKFLRDPRTKTPLQLLALDSRNEPPGNDCNVYEGILQNSASDVAYPILGGVPVMLDSAFPAEFLERHAARIAQDTNLSRRCLPAGQDTAWSFSSEWDEHFRRNTHRTWGWTVDERVELFLLEAQVESEWCKGKLILDAGCGNGSVSEGISALGAEVIGLDLSTGVFHAEQRRQSQLVHFVEGDLLRTPFAPETFDLVISIGVLHHTPNAHKAFAEIAKLVKSSGKLYVWLYRRPEGILLRYLKYPLLDSARRVVSRLPARLQALCVKSYAKLVQSFHRFKGSYDGIAFPEYVVAAYDDLTPQWRSYHTPWEVCRWLFDAGFSAPVLTHWDNPYGFGLVATKTAQRVTPGIHYGKSAKLWESRSTLRRLERAGTRTGRAGAMQTRLIDF